MTRFFAAHSFVVRGGFLALLFLAAAPAASAQGLDVAKQYVNWTATVSPASAAPGETVQLVLHAEIASDWKMYAMDSPPPTRGVAPELAALPAGLSAVGEAGFSQSEPEEGYDRAFRKNVRYFEGDASFSIPLSVSGEAASGPHEVSGAVNFMVCDLEKCLPPTDEHFSVTLTVTPGE